MIISASLVVLLSAFNGIESMVEKLYSEYDADISVRSSAGKTFDSTTVDLGALRKMDGVIAVSKAIEETVILNNRKKWVNAKMVGVDFNFVNSCNLTNHLVEGFPDLEENGNPTAVIGATLLDKLDGYISQLDGYQELKLYAPLRDASIAKRKSPFFISPIKVVGRMNYNKDVNMSDILVPLTYAQTVLNYDKDLTAIYLSVDKSKLSEVKSAIQEKLGQKFIIKTAAEKNELIFKTSESEKKIVILIGLFIFILAAFNLVASIYMLYIEKSENIQTMRNFGATVKQVFAIFFFEGILISLIGVVLGLGIGVGVCEIQMQTKAILMPGTMDAFPIILRGLDLFWIALMLVTLSVIMSFIPVRILVKRSL